MNEEINKKKILDFLAAQQLCVISTIHVDGSGPESAVIAFAERDSLELVFGTSNTSRKYKNIQKNKNVSFVIGWSRETGTVQYEGIVTEIPQENSQRYADILMKKNPDSEKFVNRQDQRYFVVAPKWIRFLDIAANPPETHEINF